MNRLTMRTGLAALVLAVGFVLPHAAYAGWGIPTDPLKPLYCNGTANYDGTPTGFTAQVFAYQVRSTSDGQACNSTASNAYGPNLVEQVDFVGSTYSQEYTVNLTVYIDGAGFYTTGPIPVDGSPSPDTTSNGIAIATPLASGCHFYTVVGNVSYNGWQLSLGQNGNRFCH